MIRSTLVPVLIATAIAAPVSAGICPDYAPPLRDTRIDRPGALAAADVDGDGAVDLLVTNDASFAADTLAVARNAGNGALETIGHYPASSPRDVAVGDLNGDGAVDVVVAVDFGLSVRLNAGDGTFGAEIVHALGGVGTYPSVALGDLDGDGDLDAACADQSITAIRILLNDGLGALTEVGSVPVMPGMRSIAVGDVDGDGDGDLVGLLGFANEQSVLVAFNAGDATFPSRTRFDESGIAVASLVVEDVDGDGVDDIALAAHTDGAVRIRYGSADARFGDLVIVAVDAEPAQMAFADLDGDGDRDLAVVHPGAGTISVHLDAGDGRTFVAHATFANVPSASRIAAADLNGDGVPDLVTSSSAEGVLSMQLASCPLSCAADLDTSGDVGFGDLLRITSHWGPCGSCAEDLDGDGLVGFEDLVLVLSSWGPCALPGACCLLDGTCVEALVVGGADCAPTIGTYLGDDSKCADAECVAEACLGFDEAIAHAVAQDPRDVAVADLDGDGHRDIAVACSNGHGVSLLLGDGAGGFPSTAFDSLGFFRLPSSIAVGDLDLDGDRDVVLTDALDRIMVRLNEGDGSFANGGEYPFEGFLGRVALGDMNGDGLLDIVALALSPTSRMAVFLNTGSGQFAPGVLHSASLGPTGLALGDVDADGDVDVAVTAFTSDAVRLYLNDGGGTSFTSIFVGFGGQLANVVIRDFDGDGQNDLAATEYGEDRIGVRRLTGSLEIGPYSNVAAGIEPWSLACADLDLDGDLDLVVSSQSDGTVTTVVNVGAGVFATGPSIAMSASDLGLALGDLDEDGRPDIAAVDRLTDAVSTTVSTCPPIDPPPGACCLTGGLCETVPADVCTQMGGVAHEPGVTCAEFDCPPPGACCLPDGSCLQVPPLLCISLGGDHQGDSSDCAVITCPLGGACCFDDATCAVLTEGACADAGGSFAGAGTDCTINCAVGACCLDDGTCFDVTPATCAIIGGAFSGLGIPCAEIECP